MKQACLYVRVSTDEQADKGFSQRDQAERLQIHCLRNDIEVKQVIFEDYSAKTFNRPEWTKLLAELKKSKGKAFDYVMFTKWDRFSRNTADAYQMIRTLAVDYKVEPIAIEQPLDLSVPESKTILAVYLSMPEVENDRRALNVTYGMRRAKKEGRWMGKALPGYKNRITEDGKHKYIALDEPEATHMKWAFEHLAKGTFATEHVWMMAKERGLRCARTSFWDAVKNPVYCGKIIVPKFKDEEMYLADGIHDPLIPESLFYKVQDIINGRRRNYLNGGAKASSSEEYPLRGFLTCPVCGRNMTGSSSKGRRALYYYYHCKLSCKQRFRADLVNGEFERELKRFVPRRGMAELFEMVICDAYNDDSKYLQSQRKLIAEGITAQNNRSTKARELLLMDTLTSDEYKLIKSECDEAIIRYEAQLKELENKVSHGIDIQLMVTDALSHLKSLSKLYSDANLEGKRYIIGVIFPEKWVFDGKEHHTTKMNDAAHLIYHINNKLRHKKTGAKSLENLNSGNVPSAGVEPARFPTGV